MKNNEKQYQLNSTVIDGLAGWAEDNGLDGQGDDFAKMIRAQVMTDLEDNGRKELTIKGAGGKSRTVKANDKEAKFAYRGSGATEKLVESGGREEVLLGRCSFLTRALIATSIATTELRCRGYYGGWTVLPESDIAFALNEAKKDFKPRPAPKQEAPAQQNA